MDAAASAAFSVVGVSPQVLTSQQLMDAAASAAFSVVGVSP
jgi:hypothetical protein